MVIFFLILRATYFPIFLATKIWRILPPEYHQLYWKNKFLEIYNIKGETKIREIDPPKFTKFGGTISEKYQGNSGEYVIRWFHGKNCSNAYRGPRHCISNILIRRHYKNSCYVFIYLHIHCTVLNLLFASFFIFQNIHFLDVAENIFLWIFEKIAFHVKYLIILKDKSNRSAGWVAFTLNTLYTKFAFTRIPLVLNRFHTQTSIRYRCKIAHFAWRVKRNWSFHPFNSWIVGAEHVNCFQVWMCPCTAGAGSSFVWSEL